jgi:CxxC-x17-CxxC domain-containing protein
MKKKSKKTGSGKETLPELVTVLAKLVERIETVEKKVDLVAGRVAALPSEIGNLVQSGPRSGQQLSQVQPAQRPAVSGQNQVPREKILYEAVCADCRKNCKVPFRPSPGRPIYCPECFAIRKAGHVPKDPDQRFGTSQLHQRVAALTQKAIQESVPPSEQGKILDGKKSRSSKTSGKKTAKKKKK